MTEPKDTALTLWERIRWPHVVVFAICVAGALGFAIFLPDDRWGLVERVVISVLGGGSAVGWLVSGGALKAPHEIPPPASIPPRPAPRRIDREDGSVDAYALLMVVAVAVGIMQTIRLAWPWLSRLLVVLLVLGPLTGCGSSLAAHATAAQVMGLALDGAYDVAEGHAVEATDACVTAGSEECVLEVHASMQPVAIALTGLEVAWSGYVSAIELGHLAGTSEPLLEAMRSAAVRMLDAYSMLAEALSRAGVTLPAVPPMVLALVGAS